MQTRQKFFVFFTVISLLFLLASGLVLPLRAAWQGGKENFGVNRDVSSKVINDEVRNLNREIRAKKSRLNYIKEQQRRYSEIIAQKQKENASLKNQMAILENRIAKAELDIELTEIEIDKINLEINKTDLAIKTKQSEITREKEKIALTLRLLYKNDQADTLEILLLNDSLTEFLNQARDLEDVTSALKSSVESLKRHKKDLEREKVVLSTKKAKAEELKKELVEKIEKLEAEKENKKYLLEQVKLSERTYQRLLAQARKEQQDAALEIASLEKLVRAKLAKLQGKELEFSDAGFIWPVPRNVITAYFHDPDYPYRYIFEHPAIDMRAAQGTPIKAAASGYVARAKDGGYGYSYIMLIHGNGLATVYGHVSKIYVKEGDYVVQGQVIGLTGGMPGTPGAGRLTTGPHLHLEVRKNGIPVDPLHYLP